MFARTSHRSEKRESFYFLKPAFSADNCIMFYSTIFISLPCPLEYYSMSLIVSRTNVRVNPDHKKVIARFLNTGDARSLLIIQKVLQLKPPEAEVLLADILTDFDR